MVNLKWLISVELLLNYYYKISIIILYLSYNFSATFTFFHHFVLLLRVSYVYKLGLLQTSKHPPYGLCDLIIYPNEYVGDKVIWYLCYYFVSVIPALTHSKGNS